MKLTRSVLVAAATELNKAIGIDPPIDVEASAAALKKKVREAALELVTEDDELSEDTQAVVDFFKSENGDGDGDGDGDDKPAAKPAKKKASKKKAAKKPADDEEEEEDDSEEDEEEDEPTKKPKPKAAKSSKKKKEKADKPARYSRADALLEALTEGGTREEIIDRSEELYVEHGGTTSAGGAKSMANIHLPVLMLFGTVVKKGDRYTLAK